MTFQSTVRAVQTTGNVGEISNEGPSRVKPYILDSSASGESNTIGNVFTKIANGVATVGGAGVFLGILINPKTHALQGTAAGTLEATLDLPDNSNGELLDMGILFVNLATAGGNVGDVLKFNTTTGLIDAGAPGGGEAAIPNAKIIQDDIPAAGLAKIQLTN